MRDLVRILEVPPNMAEVYAPGEWSGMWSGMMAGVYEPGGWVEWSGIMATMDIG